MSARSASVGPSPQSSRATTLVGVGRDTSRPPKERSRSSTNADVSTSSNDSSGLRCKVTPPRDGLGDEIG